MAKLGYNLAFHLHCELPRRAEQAMRLTRLNQSMTYGGLLAGVPDKRFNEVHIAHALKEAALLGPPGVKPFLIEPTRRDYLRKPGDMDSYPGRVRHQPEWLPLVTCVAALSTIDMRAVAVWFQDEYAMPIDDAVVDALATMDLSVHGVVIEW